MTKSLQGHHLNKLWWVWSPRWYIPSFMKIGSPVLEKKIFKGFFIHRRGGHLGLVTQMPRTNFRSPYPRRLYIKFGFEWPSGFGEDLWAFWTDRRRTDGRTPDHEYPISSLMSLWPRWAKNTNWVEWYSFLMKVTIWHWKAKRNLNSQSYPFN